MELSAVPDNRTVVNVEACVCECYQITHLYFIEIQYIDDCKASQIEYSLPCVSVHLCDFTPWVSTLWTECFSSELSANQPTRLSWLSVPHFVANLQGGPEKTECFYFTIISTNVGVFSRFFCQGWDTSISFYCEKHFQNVHFIPHFF